MDRGSAAISNFFNFLAISLGREAGSVLLVALAQGQEADSDSEDEA
jgi:hypothetical protein